MKVAIVVLCVALVAVSAVTATLLVRSKGPGIGTPTGGSGSPTATATSPSTTPRNATFLDGMRQLTTSPSYAGIIGGTDDLAILAEFGDFAHPMAIDKNTGATVWEGQDGNCSGIIAGESLVCTMIIDSQGDEGDASWLSVQTGQSEGNLDMSSIGAYTYDLTATSQGVLAIGGDYNWGNYPPDQISAVIGYFTGPGAPKWTTQVQMYASVDEDPVAQPFDEAAGLFAWHINANTYVLDAQTGFVVYQANSYSPAQVFSNRLACVSSNNKDSQSINLQVNVPGGSPATITTCDSPDAFMMPLGPGHSDMLIMTTSGSINGCTTEAHDPANPWSSPLWSNPGSAYCATNMAWDGQSTGYAASSDGKVWAFDVNTGKLLWQSSYQTDGVGDYWDPQVSVSDGLVTVDLYSQGILDFPGFTALRADNGQQIPSLSSDYGQLTDGVLLTWSQDSSTWNVYVPSFGSAQPSPAPTAQPT